MGRSGRASISGTEGWVAAGEALRGAWRATYLTGGGTILTGDAVGAATPAKRSAMFWSSLPPKPGEHTTEGSKSKAASSSGPVSRLRFDTEAEATESRAGVRIRAPRDVHKQTKKRRSGAGAGQTCDTVRRAARAWAACAHSQLIFFCLHQTVGTSTNSCKLSPTSPTGDLVQRP